MDNPMYFYIEANLFCIAVACIFLFRELRSVDKQLRAIEFIKTIFIYIVFYIFDIIWAITKLESVESSCFFDSIIHFCIFLVFTYGSYQWFIYSEVSQGDSFIYKFKKRLLWVIPNFISCILLFIYTIIVYSKGTDEDIKVYEIVVHIAMVLTSFFYEICASIKAMRRMYKLKNQLSKGFFLNLAINPLLFTSFILLQILFLEIPIFCFLNTIAMICFYLKGLDNVISIDSLTKLNNRNQLNKFFHQLQVESEFENYIMVIDIDKFKYINDKFGHLEGDNALVIVANSFRAVCGNYKYRCFISRYGGDEFVIIAQAVSRNDVEELKKLLNETLISNTKDENKPYKLQVSIGISIIDEPKKQLSYYLEKADKEMYEEKKHKKISKIK